MARLNKRIVLFNDNDLSGDVRSAAQDVQTIYIQAVSGILSVDAPSAWVTANDESVSGNPPDASSGQIPHWTTKKPTYQSNYPIIFVAEQKKVVSGEITCTTPVKDDSLTIIDGGHITTGTIDSNRLNAYTIKVNAANIQGSLTIGKVDGLQTALNGKQPSGDYATNTALTNATDWAVVIEVTAINYTNSTATLKATVLKGGVAQTSGFTLQWYKNSTKITSGGTSATLSVTDLDASYTCIAS